MKYTLLTAAALATVAIAAPAPEKAISLPPADNTRAVVNEDTVTFTLDIQPFLDALRGSLKTAEVPTQRKAKAKRGHDQGALLVNTFKDLLSKVQGHSNEIDNTLLRIRSGSLSGEAGTQQCTRLLGDIASLLQKALGSLKGLPTTGSGNSNNNGLLDLVDDLATTISDTVNSILGTPGLGGGQIGSGALAPLFQSLSDLLECILGIDPSLGTGIRDILDSFISGVGTGTGNGGANNGGGLLGLGRLLGGSGRGLLAGVLDPVQNLLQGLELEVEVEVEVGGDSDGSSGEENSSGNGSSGSGSGSSGSGNESPVYNVPT